MQHIAIAISTQNTKIIYLSKLYKLCQIFDVCGRHQVLQQHKQYSRQ